MKSEGRIQQDAFTLIREKYPETYGAIFHVPNGALRDGLTASVLTGQGVTPGIQDIWFIWAGKVYIIEVKDDTGIVSTEQKVVHSQHKIQGFDTYILRTTEQIIYFVKYVIEGRSLDGFKRFISPYSNTENYQIYLEQMRIERKRKAENKQKLRLKKLNRAA
jgi:hypothetical protein